MNKNSVDCARYLIALLSAAVCGEKAPLPIDNINWKELLELANRHSVANIVYYPLKDVDFEVDPNAFAGFKDARNKAVSREARQELEKEQIAQRLEQEGIKFIFLKGSVIKDLYPLVDMRTMADLDLLVESGKYTSLRSIMQSFGYEHQLDCNLHDVYYKRPVMNVEIHKYMMDMSFKEVNDYFGGDFERAEPVEGYKYRYCLNKEDFFAYLIAHTAKHYYSSGTGIRSILDIFIYLRAYEEVLDWSKVNSILERLELLKFANDMLAISKLWFGGEKPVKSFEKMEEYIISNGTYGISENEISNRFIAHYGDTRFLLIRKLRYFASTAFPGRKYMSVNYPVINRAPILLPAFWVVRFVTTFSHNRNNIKYRMKGVAKLKKDDIKARPKY